MSEVWLARDKQSDNVVALKFLSAELAGQPAARDRLHKEWRIGSRLMHAHIVRVFEFHDDPNGAYFSLQNIDGPDIAALSGTNLHNFLGPRGGHSQLSSQPREHRGTAQDNRVEH
jgi:serine/threonine protein kinase